MTGGPGQDAPDLPDLPELAMFDRRATRGAVVRGLLRTAMIALGLYLAFQAAGYMVGIIALGLNDRGERFDRLGRTAFDVGHPDLLRNSPRGGNFSGGWWGTTNSFLRLTPDGDPVRIKIEMSTFGAISPVPLGDTALDRALAGGRTTPAAAAAFVRGLPASSRTDVIIDLARPVDEDQLAEVYGRVSGSGQVGFPVAFYADPYPAGEAGFRTDLSGDVLQQRPVSWPGTVSVDFSAWTASLRSEDDDDLARMGLPDSATLRRLGDRPEVHALYVQGVTPPALLAILDDPAVRSLTPVSSRLALAGSPP